jgi:type IV pilus assembly PilO-like protein
LTAKLARNKVTIAASFLVVLVLLLAYLVLVSPKRSRASELDGEIAAAQVELGRLRAQEARVEQPTVPVAKVARLKKAMPDRMNMPALLLEIARVARNTGISFDSITPSEPVPVSGYQKVPVSLVFEGNFFALNDFLYRMRNLVQVRDDRLRVKGRLFAIDAIDFAEGSDKFPQIQATLTANAFLYGGAPPAAATTPPASASTDASATGATP